MAVMVMLEVTAKDGAGNDLLQKFKDILPDTRTYDGCIGVDTYQNQDNPNVLVLVEKWESKPHYEKYLAWRTESGMLGEMAEMFGAPPSIRYFGETDA